MPIGTAMPPSPASTGRATRRRCRSSPTSNSRRASRPTTKKKNVIRPLFTQWRRSSATPESLMRTERRVCQTDSYDEASTFTHTSAAIVAASRKAALPVSVRRNPRSGVSRLRAQAVRSEKARLAAGGSLMVSSRLVAHRPSDVPDGMEAHCETSPLDSVRERLTLRSPSDARLRARQDDPRRSPPTMTLGLPPAIRACLFDLDGVLTQTATVHAAAWKEMFDAFLHAHAARTGAAFVPFDPVRDYDEYVDGKPRYDGVRSFLAARSIRLPEGSTDDPPVAETVHGLGNRKNELVLALIQRDGVMAYEGSIRYVHAVRDAQLHRAVVSSSANCKEVLEAAEIDDLFEVRIDAIVARREHLQGKPAPDTFLAAARALGVEPAEAAVFEDALAGVAAGRAGRFGFVVGVDRAGQADALREHGADVVVSDLAELLEPR